MPRLTDVTLLRQFRDAARARLEARGADATLEWRVGELSRAAGDLVEAATSYREYARRHPNDVDAARAAARRVPFLWRPRLLDALSVARLHVMLAQHAGEFEPSGVVNDEPEVDTRLRVSLMQFAGDDLRSLLLPAIRRAITDCRALFPVEEGLEESSDVEVQITAHLDGAFYAPHRDRGPATDRRRVTFVYYVHRTPARFTGGDLLLFDEGNEGEDAAHGFTRIVPASNLLICFPSDRLHEVTQVACPSDDPLDGRLTVNGWFRTAKEDC